LRKRLKLPTESRARTRSAIETVFSKWRKPEFTRVGANASLEDIAKKSGVGPGTLYRHFPTREELLVAVYRSEMESCCGGAEVRGQHVSG
jgi:hypothetical protein